MIAGRARFADLVELIDRLPLDERESLVDVASASPMMSAGESPPASARLDANTAGAGASRQPQMN